MKKYRPISKHTFEQMFSAEEQERAKSTLKAFNEVNVTFENGAYHFNTSVMLRNSYPEDFEFIGCIYADDIFTEEEQMINYIESFHDYPHGYKGTRNYGMLREIEGNWDVKFKLDDRGNLVIA